MSVDIKIVDLGCKEDYNVLNGTMFSPKKKGDIVMSRYSKIFWAVFSVYCVVFLLPFLFIGGLSGVWFGLLINGLLLALCVTSIIEDLLKKKDAKEQLQLQVSKVEQTKKDALHSHLPAMTANYNRLRRLFDVPVNCDIIAVETTVFGIKYDAKAPGGMMHLLRKNFYFWTSGDNLYIIPTEEHLSPQHITASTLPKDLMGILNDTDIPLYMIHRSDIQYFKLSGQERAETNIKSRPIVKSN